MNAQTYLFTAVSRMLKYTIKPLRNGETGQYKQIQILLNFFV